jgi:hypothetical protein
MMGFRAAPALRAAIVKWAEGQRDKPTLSEAVRRLVELGLTVKTGTKTKSDKQKARASELAGTTIDRLHEVAASFDDKASRKRRLVKGPSEFRDVRVDRPKRKS